MVLPGASEQAIYAIEPATGDVRRVLLADLDNVAGIYGLTSDGKTAVVLAHDPSHVKPAGIVPVGRSLWAVNLDTGKHTLISDHSIMAAVLPSPKHGRDRIRQQSRPPCERR